MALTCLKAIVRVTDLTTWLGATTINTIQSVTLLKDGDFLLIIYT